MLDLEYEQSFLEIIEKIKDNSAKEKVKKQIAKIINNPEVGKPMMYDRKGTREVYVHPFRLSHTYVKEKSKIIFHHRK